LFLAKIPSAESKRIQCGSESEILVFTYCRVGAVLGSLGTVPDTECKQMRLKNIITGKRSFKGVPMHHIKLNYPIRKDSNEPYLHVLADELKDPLLHHGVGDVDGEEDARGAGGL
jgi:hypothetical protein